MHLVSRKCSFRLRSGNILFLLSISLLALFFNFAVPSALALQVPQPGANNFVTSAVNQVGPAVVRIDTERTIVRNIDPFMTDPFFQRFFGEEFFNTAPREELQRGQGSGFIIDSNGIILTNAHVVSGADRVQVTLKDGRSFEGNVLGTDRVTDLAVVEIDDPQGQLPMAPLGDSDRVQVGDWAIAVGNPLGLDNTVTLGIISTLNRPSSEVGIPDKRVDFIQTDAAINPGNSGGPLLNDQGEVIGINTAIRANATGIGFAIPINKAKAIQGQLTKGEKVAHPYIGVQIINLTPELAKENNSDPNAPLFLPEIEGVLVMKVIPDTPAADAGLRRGDVIIAIDNQPIKTADELQRIVDQSGLGTSLSIQVKRGNQTRQFRVKTAQLEEVMEN
ncbi:HhoA/HhoB/HtrA family serine endopeptidase [Roseofilum sp. Guam]|uniref:HhoA/HhoB/HtrA family serine endopeptidase n=1 Tax=Roseofilum sp. Guam TaxID=2821502 RepID=UPI001B0DAA9A|nr:HhoA/HhoB/HtrA family serine endopeptidase [Roseofilum sp. Guam]MBP0030610.1 trypsin-like peptidase domain-containing protein [Roseofilum sp. Guam]